MPDLNLPEVASQWANDVLLWIGFGTLVGLLAKAIMPGHDRGGALATLLMGIAGSVIGSGTLMFFVDGLRVTPISPLGFVVATAGAFILLFFYRLLAGRIFTEEGEGPVRGLRIHRARRRTSIVEDE